MALINKHSIKSIDIDLGTSEKYFSGQKEWSPKQYVGKNGVRHMWERTTKIKSQL